jgi:hypothetical protein
MDCAFPRPAGSFREIVRGALKSAVRREPLKHTQSVLRFTVRNIKIRDRVSSPDGSRRSVPRFL